MRTRILSVALLTMMSASLASASPITIPADLAPGSIYYLAFVTNSTHDALSADIGAYDTFVTGEANMDPALATLGTTWKAIGSTASVDAITHVGVTGPVYNLNGQEIATGAADMFDGTLDAPIDFDQYGNLLFNHVWTGSTINGTGYSGQQLGTADPALGYSPLTANITGQSWILWGVFNGAVTNTIPTSVYGISGPLEVPNPVPEPSTISLMLSPAFLLLGKLRGRRNRPA